MPALVLFDGVVNPVYPGVGCADGVSFMVGDESPNNTRRFDFSLCGGAMCLLGALCLLCSSSARFSVWLSVSSFGVGAFSCEAFVVLCD